jgi:hypothetical protein
VSDYVTDVKLAELTRSVDEIKTGFDEIKSFIRSQNDLWDSSDIVRNWHVSDRTLADWRRKCLLGFVQIGKKIYYPRVEREQFLKNHLIKAGICL